MANGWSDGSRGQRVQVSNHSDTHHRHPRVVSVEGIHKYSGVHPAARNRAYLISRQPAYSHPIWLVDRPGRQGRTERAGQTRGAERHPDWASSRHLFQQKQAKSSRFETSPTTGPSGQMLVPFALLFFVASPHHRRFYVAKGAISVPAGEPVTPPSKEARFVRMFALWDLSVRRPDSVYDFKWIWRPTPPSSSLAS